MAWTCTNFAANTDNEYIGDLTVQDDETGFTYTGRVDVTDQKGRDDFKARAIEARQHEAERTTKRDAIIAQMLTEMNKG